MVIGVAVGGTLVFRRYQTEAAIGFLVGITAMMAQMFFVLFCLFVSYGHTTEPNETKDQSDNANAADEAYAAFAFLLFLDYAIVSASIMIFRSDLLPAVDTTVTGNAGPVAQPSQGNMGVEAAADSTPSTAV